MKKKVQKKQIKLDKEEKDFLKSFENDEWTSIKKVNDEKRIAKEASVHTLRKDIRINIRLSSSDVSSIKQMAAYEGIPYQTLISSILHKYAAGHLHYSHLNGI